VALHFGVGLYGAVDRVPGLCYVATQFGHANFLPLFPYRTYLVREGSEQGEAFAGKRIPLSLKSVLAGYVRAWVGLAAIVLFGLIGVLTPMFLRIPRHQEEVIWMTIGAIVGISGSFFVLLTRWRAWALVELLLLAGSVVIWFLGSQGANPALPRHQRLLIPEFLPLIPLANALLLACSLTRIFDWADYDRAIQLAQELEAEEEEDEDLPGPSGEENP